MVGADAAVGGTKRDAASRAVGDEKPVEGVASPVESQSMANYACHGVSSTVNRVSSITAFVNAGLRTESRPTPARNWISRKDTGETPQGRYGGNHENSVSRFEPRTSQIRKWVSRRRVTAQTAAVKRARVQGATCMTSGPRCPHPVPVEVACMAGRLGHGLRGSTAPDAAPAGVLCAVRRSPRLRGLRQGDETSSFWPRMPLPSSYVQCKRPSGRSSRQYSGLHSWRLGEIRMNSAGSRDFKLSALAAAKTGIRKE
jgi:hypothetical protein